MSTFSTMALIQPRGVLWLVRQRIAEHRQQYGGQPPDHLILHTPVLRALFEEYAREQGVPLAELPPVENVVFGGFEGVKLYHCRCGQPLARDLLSTCEGKDEDL